MLFWVLASSLALVAVAFFVVPLLRGSVADRSVEDKQRDENLLLFAERERELEAELSAGTIDAQEHGTLLRELQLSLLDDVNAGEPGSDDATKSRLSGTESQRSSPMWLAVLVAVMLPAVALSLYQRWGFIEDVTLMDLFQQTLAAQGDATAASALVVDLGKVVREDEDKPWAWYFLGENFATLGMFNEAQIAYLQAAERLQGEPEEALVLGRAALALYIKSEFEFSAELRAIVERAQAINPNEIAVVQLLAADAQNRGDYAAAIANWRLLIQSDPNSLEAQSLRAEIANAQRLLREESGEPIQGPVVEVRLALAEGLQLDPDWRVFVAVRNAQQQGLPPLAARDLRVRDLPVTLELDNDSAVGPFNLSSAELVTVSALVSRAGIANPAAGDYRVVSSVIEPEGSRTVVSLVIADIVE